MTTQDWIDFLKNEAISNYVVFFAGLIVATVGWLIANRLTKDKPSLVRVEKKYKGELIRIDPEAKENLQITYKGQAIDELHQTIFTIGNIGTKPIRDIDITFHLDDFEEQNFIEAVLTNEEEISTIEIRPQARDLRSFAIHLPFLNPRKEYEDYLGVTIYTLKPLSIKAVTRKGYGWDTQYFDKASYIERLIGIIIKSTSPLEYLISKLVGILVRF